MYNTPLDFDCRFTGNHFPKGGVSPLRHDLARYNHVKNRKYQASLGLHGIRRSNRANPLAWIANFWIKRVHKLSTFKIFSYRPQ